MPDKQKSTRDGFGEGLLEAARQNKNVVVVSADLAESTRVLAFAKKYPERFIEVGVAEQNAAGVAAGLALSGKIPYLASFSVFSPGRNWDQIRVGICYSRANVKIVGSHAGLSTGEDGASHQALEDIAIMRTLPEMTVIQPADFIEAKKAAIAISQIKGPVYLRLTRQNSPQITSMQSRFVIGQANILKPGTDITIIGCGPILYEAILASQELKKQNINPEIINCHTIKPLDKKTILKSVQKTKHVVTIEDHQAAGGLGSAVAEFLSQEYPVPMKIIGVQDTFGESGKSSELWEKYKISNKYIVEAVLKILKP